MYVYGCTLKNGRGAQQQYNNEMLGRDGKYENWLSIENEQYKYEIYYCESEEVVSTYYGM